MSSSRPSPRPTSLIVLGLAALLALVLAACGSDDDGSVDAGGSTTEPPAGGTDDGGDAAGDAAGGGATRAWIAGDWVLQSATGPDGPLTLPANSPIELGIAGPDQLSGTGGCNSLGGIISAPFDGDRDGGDLTISEVFMTEIGCEHLEFETAYVGLLTSATEWELAPPSELIFRGDGIELVYGIGQPAVPVALEGTTWVFDTVFDGSGVERTASTPRLDLPLVTAVIEDGTMTLQAAGCADLSVPVSYTPGTTEGPFTPEPETDLLAAVDCGDAESNLSQAVDGVAQATGFQIVESRLTLIGLPGETVSFSANDG